MVRCQYGYNALMFASREGHAEVVDILLRGGANVNDSSDVCTAIRSPPIAVLIVFVCCLQRGRTALMLAADGNVTVVALLLKAGANVNAQNNVFIQSHHNIYLCCHLRYLFTDWEKCIDVCI